MDYKITELVDIPTLQRVLDDFSHATGIPSALTDMEGNIITRSGWPDICMNFHLVEPGVSLKCIESPVMVNNIINKNNHTLYKCSFGLLHMTSPVIVEENHLANICTGQFLCEPPDMEFFKKQAHIYKFDEELYLKALKEVPILPEEKVTFILKFLSSFAEMVADLGLQRLKHLKMEKSLKDSEEKHRLLIENIRDAIFIIQNEKIIFASDRAFELTGYTFEEVSSKPIFEFMHPDDREMMVNYYNKRIKGFPVPGVYEFRAIDKNGQVVWVDSKVVKIDWKGTFALMAIFADITERKKSEEALKNTNKQLEEALSKLKETQEQLVQQERLKALGQIASGIAHDINNALTPILGYCELLSLSDHLDGEDIHSVSSIKTLSKDIASTVARMKEFYRPHLTQDIYPINLNKIVLEVLDLTKPRWKDISHKNSITVEIETKFDDRLPFILAAESEIREALTNLIFNSLDAMPSGGKITICTHSRKDKVSIEIIDTGTGMEEDTKKHCLEPFFTTKGQRGTGLGLAMVYGIVKRHSGDIEIESEAGIGTTIRLVFVKPEDKKFDEKISYTDSPSRSFNILCIDDEPQVFEILQLILRKEKHIVEVAEGGEKGLEIFFNRKNIEKPFDVVISDLGMPRVDGREVARRIKEASPDTPVIIMTGWGSLIEKEAVKDIDFLISKPFTIQEIRKAFQSCFPAIRK